MGRKQAELVGNEVGGWYGLIISPSELQVPARVQQPIAELPLFEDGLLCQREPGSCQYICRSKRIMKDHWREEHGWSLRGGKGRLARRVEESLEERFWKAAKRVRCQRFFPTFHGSQYFEVCQPEREQEAQEEDQAQPAQEGGEQLWQRAWNKANRNWEELEKRARATIEDGEKDEVSPWLDRTQWLPYLARLNRDELLASIEEP
ncbi:uncharacterized protein LTHEOB_12917, partial [Neofusicoccum parvum]